MTEPRCPGRVDDPDAGTAPVDVSHGLDTDLDGQPDTHVVGDGIDLVLCTDLDGDGYADRVLRIGPDGVVREVGYRPGEPRDDVVGDPWPGWGGD